MRTKASLKQTNKRSSLKFKVATDRHLTDKHSFLCSFSGRFKIITLIIIISVTSNKLSVQDIIFSVRLICTLCVRADQGIFNWLIDYISYVTPDPTVISQSILVYNTDSKQSCSTPVKCSNFLETAFELLYLVEYEVGLFRFSFHHDSSTLTLLCRHIFNDLMQDQGKENLIQQQNHMSDIHTM